MTGPGCSSQSITSNGRQGADELAALHEAQQAHEAPSPYPTRTLLLLGFLPLIATLVLT